MSSWLVFSCSSQLAQCPEQVIDSSEPQCPLKADSCLRVQGEEIFLEISKGLAMLRETNMGVASPSLVTFET